MHKTSHRPRGSRTLCLKSCARATSRPPRHFSRDFQSTDVAGSKPAIVSAQASDRPEDVVQSVFAASSSGARAGRFTLSRSGDLWRLLASITKHKLFATSPPRIGRLPAIRNEVPLDHVDAGALR